MEEDIHKQETRPNFEQVQKAFPLPEKVGDYKIESLLNVGGMSYIFLAKHPVTSESVVVKVVRHKYLKDPDMLTRLLNEAKVIGLASHPNIVKLFDLGQWERGLRA